MATKLVLTPPCAVMRRAGTWEPLGPVEAVPHTWGRDADRVPDGQPPGDEGRYAYRRGFEYEVTPEVAAELADVRSTAKVGELVKNVRFGDWITEREVVDPVSERIVAKAPELFTQGQQAVLDALEARIAALEAAHGAGAEDVT